MKRSLLLGLAACVLLAAAVHARAQCIDNDGDGFGIGAGCIGPDVNDAASSCTSSGADSDADGIADCLDRCLDADHDDYGTNQSATIVGSGAIPVGMCTINGVTPCALGDSACIGTDCNDADPAVHTACAQPAARQVPALPPMAHVLLIVAILFIALVVNAGARSRQKQ